MTRDEILETHETTETYLGSGTCPDTFLDRATPDRFADMSDKIEFSGFDTDRHQGRT
jgi:hypothetical protein